MKPIYIYIGGMASISIALFVGYVWGQDSMKSDQLEQEVKIKLVEKEVIKTVYKTQVKREVAYRDRIKNVYKDPDPTGCRNATLGDLKLLVRPNKNPHQSSLVSTGSENRPDT